MFKKANDLLIILGIALLFEAGAFVVTVVADKLDRSISRQRRTPALSEGRVRRLVPVPDAVRNGKVSERKLLNLISAEFDRLERGEPDMKKPTQAQLRPSAQPAVDK